MLLLLSTACELETASVRAEVDNPFDTADTDVAPDTDATGAETDGVHTDETDVTGLDDTGDSSLPGPLDPCEADATNATAAPIDVLYDSRTSLGWPTGLWELLGNDTLVIDTAAAWLAFETTWGLDLRDPDLATQQVVVVYRTATSTCGLSLTSTAAWDLGDGRVALDVGFTDDSLGCDEVCDATGFALWVLALPADREVIPCVHTAGGCQDTDAP